VADVYDALRRERPYKKAIPHRRACEIIADEIGKQFDPALVQAFLEIGAGTWERLAAAATEVRQFHDAVAVCMATGAHSAAERAPAPQRAL